MENIAINNQRFCSSLIKQLIHQNIRHFCIAPGSRSTPLIASIDQHPLAKTHIHFDERGLGFFAIGMAKALQQPVAIVVTSGTALGNLLPAVIEAKASQIPLLILSADRPCELQLVGANQTIDQVKIFSGYVELFLELTPHDDIPIDEMLCSQISVLSKSAAKGPVHLNIKFQEPFLPTKQTTKLFDHPISNKKIKIAQTKAEPVLADLESISHLIDNEEAGIIINTNCDSQEDLEAICALSKTLHYPLFCEILSNAHAAEIDFVSLHELIIKKGKSLKQLKPKHVIIFGNQMISKDTLLWLKECGLTTCVYVSTSKQLFDPMHICTHWVQTSVASFTNLLLPFISKKKDYSFYNYWTALSENAMQQLQTFPWDTQEHSFIYHLINSLQGPTCFIGNSMPIRLMNLFYHKNISMQKCFALRGASGIDGNIAAACGIAIARNQHIDVVIGDQTALHDLNSIALMKQTPSMHLYILNNGGGNIFSQLPIAKHPHLLNKYFYCSHTYNFKDISKMFEIDYIEVKDISQLKLFSCKHALIEITIKTTPGQQYMQEFIEELPLKLKHRYASPAKV